MTGDLPPRREDIVRHLADLRSRSYEGVRDWPGRVSVFRRAVALLDPVVREVLGEASRDFLAGTGVAHFHEGEDRDGGVYAHWELTWPRQREAGGSQGRRGVEPVQVMVTFPRGTTHPHLRGAAAGMWPCQVTSEADARRQEPIVRAIVEAELHERIFQGSWEVIPSFTAAPAPEGTR
jgi:hypothetical protein